MKRWHGPESAPCNTGSPGAKEACPSLSTKPVFKPIPHGFDYRGQTRHTQARPHSQRGQRQMTPSQISFQAFKAMGKALCQHTAGHIPSPFIETLNPVRRGWANENSPGYPVASLKGGQKKGSWRWSPRSGRQNYSARACKIMEETP